MLTDANYLASLPPRKRLASFLQQPRIVLEAAVESLDAGQVSPPQEALTPVELAPPVPKRKRTERKAGGPAPGTGSQMAGGESLVAAALSKALALRLVAQQAYVRAAELRQVADNAMRVAKTCARQAAKLQQEELRQARAAVATSVQAPVPLSDEELARRLHVEMNGRPSRVVEPSSKVSVPLLSTALPAVKVGPSVKPLQGNALLLKTFEGSDGATESALSGDAATPPLHGISPFSCQTQPVMVCLEDAGVAKAEVVVPSMTLF